MLEEARDRYGPLPASVLNLADYGRIRVMADRLGIDTIDREGRIVVLKFRPQAKIDPVRLVALVRQRPELTLVPPAALKLNLDGGWQLGSGGSGPKTGIRPPPAPRPERQPQKERARVRERRAELVDGAGARGEVTPGFTKAEILRPAKEDPRAPGGVFERVGGLVERPARSKVKCWILRNL